jgi:hypothetical protein
MTFLANRYNIIINTCRMTIFIDSGPTEAAPSDSSGFKRGLSNSESVSDSSEPEWHASAGLKFQRVRGSGPAFSTESPGPEPPGRADDWLRLWPSGLLAVG